MTAGSARAVPLRWVFVLLLVSVAAANAADTPQPQAAKEPIQAFLDAGEFAPTLDLARKCTDAKQRDAMLGRIAQAQASAGSATRVVAVRSGVHLIRCDEIKPGTKKLADVRKELEDALSVELLGKLSKAQRSFTSVKYTGAIPPSEPATPSHE